MADIGSDHLADKTMCRAVANRIVGNSAVLPASPWITNRFNTPLSVKYDVSLNEVKIEI